MVQERDGCRVPQYASPAAACAVGCFECGARLPPDEVRATRRPPGLGTHRVRCPMCGEDKVFDVIRHNGGACDNR